MTYGAASRPCRDRKSLSNARNSATYAVSPICSTTSVVWTSSSGPDESPGRLTAARLRGCFDFSQAPTISSISASSASAGQQVTITGTNFGATRAGRYVTFSDNGINWGAPVDLALFTIDSWNDTSITFTVPEPSGPGNEWAVSSGTTARVTVTMSGGTSNSVSLGIS